MLDSSTQIDPTQTAPVAGPAHPATADRRFRRNLTVNAVGEGLWGYQWTLIAPASVLTVLLRNLGAGERMIGSIVAVEAGALALPQILGMYIFYSRRQRQRQAILWHLFPAIPFLFASSAVAFGAEGFLSPTLSRWLLLICQAGFQLSIGVVVAAWLDWLAHIFPTERRGTAMGITFATAALGSFLGSLTAGLALAASPAASTFGWLYLIAGGMAIGSISIFWLIDDPARHDTSDTERAPTRELLGQFRRSLRERNFRAFLIGRILSSLGFCILPFVAVYFMSPAGGAMKEGAVVASFAAFTGGSAVAHLVLGRLGDRFGHRLGILLGAVMQMLTLAILLVASGPIACVLVYVTAGACASAAWLSHYNLLFETCPHDHRMAHITLGNLALSPALIIAPILAGFAAEAWGLRTLFVISLAISTMALVWFIWRVREPRHVEMLMSNEAACDPAAREV